jgi:hypothetical protein
MSSWTLDGWCCGMNSDGSDDDVPWRSRWWGVLAVQGTTCCRRRHGLQAASCWPRYCRRGPSVWHSSSSWGEARPWSEEAWRCNLRHRPSGICTPSKRLNRLLSGIGRIL